MLLLVAMVIAWAAARAPHQPMHFASNHNFDARGVYIAGRAGFDLADVSQPERLGSLPAGVSALVWVGQCQGVDRRFIATVTPFLHARRVFGFYLMDDPDPRLLSGARCSPDRLREESDWIHAHRPEARTFIVLMNLGSPLKPSYAGTYNPSNSHIDLYGIDPYPCRTELARCDEAMIDRYVAAVRAAGIPTSAIVPVFQAFGAGQWRDGNGGRYRLPSAAEAARLIAQWHAVLPAPVFDYAYSWGTQKGDHALETSPDLRAVFARHNAGLLP